MGSKQVWVPGPGSRVKDPLMGPPPGLKADGRGTGNGLAYRKYVALQEVGWPTASVLPYRKCVALQEVTSPVLLAVGDDGQPVRVVAVAAHVRVPPGHARGRRRALRQQQQIINNDKKNNNIHYKRLQ